MSVQSRSFTRRWKKKLWIVIQNYNVKFLNGETLASLKLVLIIESMCHHCYKLISINIIVFCIPYFTVQNKGFKASFVNLHKFLYFLHFSHAFFRLNFLQVSYTHHFHICQ
jgi:hypothetical protein